MDYMANMHGVKIGAVGYGGHFVYSTLDRYYKKDMDLEEALDVLRKCIHELKTRFVMNTTTFKVKVADKDGVRTVEL